MLYFIHVESLKHVFFSCPYSFQVWSHVYSWIGVSVVLHYEKGLEHYVQHGVFFREKSLRSSDIYYFGML